MAFTNNKVLDLPGNCELIAQDLEPMQMLIVAIFNRALLDLRTDTYRDDAIRFATSPWAQTLLGGQCSSRRLGSALLRSRRQYDNRSMQRLQRTPPCMLGGVRKVFSGPA